MYGFVKCVVNEYISFRIVLYIIVSIIIDNIVVIKGWILFVNVNVGIEVFLIVGYLFCNVKLINVSNIV